MTIKKMKRQAIDWEVKICHTHTDKDLSIKNSYASTIKDSLFKNEYFKSWRGCGERGPSYTVGGNASWYTHS